MCTLFSLVCFKTLKLQKNRISATSLFPIICLVLYLLSMVNFYEARYCLLSGFTEDQQEYYKEYCLFQKGGHLCVQISKLNGFARNLCSPYEDSWCFNESFCYRRYKHIPCNVIMTIMKSWLLMLRKTMALITLSKLMNFFLL